MNRNPRQRSPKINQNINQQQNPFTDINNLLTLRFMIKLNPPTISMLYKRHPKDSKKHAYNMELNDSIFDMDAQAITQQLFSEHPQYLKPKYFNQIQGLITKILLFQYYSNDFMNNEIDAEQAQEKYDQMKENGFSHEDIVWFFAQFNIEIEPMEEQEDNYDMLTQSQFNQQSMSQSQLSQNQSLTQSIYNPQQKINNQQQRQYKNQMNESKSNIQVQQFDQSQQRQNQQSQSKRKGKFDELRNLSNSRR